MTAIIGQIIGVVGTIFAMISFQFKNNAHFCFLQSCSGASFAVSFFMLGDPVSGLLNAFNILRGYAFGFGPKKTRKFFAVLLILLYIGATVFTFDPEKKELWVAMLILSAQTLGTVVMYIANAKVIRIAQVVYTSPAWMVNNVITASIGGILCEAFNFISSIIAIIRFRKEWFGKKRDTVAE